MRRPLTPWWSSQPSRFAAIPSATARVALAVLLVFMAAFVVLGMDGPPIGDADPAENARSLADAATADAIVEGVRHGSAYYPLSIEVLHAGDGVPRAFSAVRLPTLAMVEGALPARVPAVLLGMLAVAVALAWWRVVAAELPRAAARLTAIASLAAGLVVLVQYDLAALHEVWAALFVSLSLAVWRHDDWLAALGFGLAAALIRETATPYLLIMAVFAWWEGRWREMGGWIAATGVVIAVLAVHARAVALAAQPLDAMAAPWFDGGGPGFALRALVASTALGWLPGVSGVALVALAMVGWAGWKDPRGGRMLALVAVYLLLLAAAVPADAFHWAFLIAPAALVGIVFAPDTLRDLVHAALDTRRITVRRIAR